MKTIYFIATLCIIFMFVCGLGVLIKGVIGWEVILLSIIGLIGLIVGLLVKQEMEHIEIDTDIEGCPNDGWKGE